MSPVSAVLTRGDFRHREYIDFVQRRHPAAAVCCGAATPPRKSASREPKRRSLCLHSARSGPAATVAAGAGATMQADSRNKYNLPIGLGIPGWRRPIAIAPLKVRAALHHTVLILQNRSSVITGEHSEIVLDSVALQKNCGFDTPPDGQEHSAPGASDRKRF